MHKKLIKFIFFFLLQASHGECFCHPDSSNIEVKLKHDKLCTYNKEERPNNNNVSLELNYSVRGFEFEESTSTLTIQSRILHRWVDSRLKWEENKYADIQMIHISSDDVWMPQLFINNSIHHYGLGSCHPTECIVKSNGEIGCWLPCSQKAVCDADFVNWPYDAHECHIVFNSFLTQESVHFDAEALGGTIVRDANNIWKLLTVEGRIKTSDLSYVKFTFKIQRFSDIFFKHISIPGYCLIVLTLLILWIKHESTWRLILSGFNIYLHFSLMDRIWWQFPLNGSRDVPRILKYVVFMLLLSTFILVESIMIKNIIFHYPTPPLWIQKISEFLEKSVIFKYFVASPFDDLENAAKIQLNDEIKKSWITFYRVIDRLIFFAFILSFTFYNGY